MGSLALERRSRAFDRSPARRRRSLRRRSDGDSAGWRVARPGERAAGARAAVAAARPAAVGSRHDRRDRRDQRQRPAPPPIRHGPRPHHRHRDGARRRPHRQGWRPRRQERRRLRFVAAALRIVRDARRHRQRDLQTGAAAGRLVHRRRDSRERAAARPSGTRPRGRAADALGRGARFAPGPHADSLRDHAGRRRAAGCRRLRSVQAPRGADDRPAGGP